MSTENLAVAAVMESISLTDVLSPFINTGDKEPSWDGNIYIHESKEKSKEGVKRVPVQVKGKKVKSGYDFYRDKEKFSMQLADLRNYLNNGGALLFVVFLDACGKKAIFYSALVPLKLRFLLEKAEGKKTTTVELSRFPDDNFKKVGILLNFYNNIQKQASFANAELLSIDDLEKEGILQSLTIPVSGYGYKRDNPLQWYFDNDVYMYAQVKGSPIPLPIEGLITDIHVGNEVEMNISIAGKTYYDKVQRVFSKGKAELQIGKSCIITVVDDSDTMSVQLTPTSILKYAVKDLRFLIDIYDNNSIEFDGNILHFDKQLESVAEKNKEHLQTRLEYCEKVVNLFDALRIDKNIDLGKLSEQDLRHIATLIKGIVENEEISGLSDNMPFVTNVRFLGSKIALCFDKQKKAGTYRIYDFFHTPFIYWVEDDDGIKYPTSIFDILKADDFINIINVDYDAILEAYQGIEEEYIYDRANMCLLEMLSAFDKSGETRKDIVNEAEKFAKWIQEKDSDDTRKSIRSINLIQTHKRQGCMTKEEILVLKGLLQSKNEDNQVKTGAALLLDNQLMAEEFFSQLTDEERNTFKKYPIYKFWRNN